MVLRGLVWARGDFNQKFRLSLILVDGIRFMIRAKIAQTGEDHATPLPDRPGAEGSPEDGVNHRHTKNTGVAQ